MGIKLDKEHWHEYVPKSIEANVKGQVTILWNQQAKKPSLTTQRTS